MSNELARFQEVITDFKRNQVEYKLLGADRLPRPEPERMRACIRMLRNLMFPGYYIDDDLEDATQLELLKDFAYCMQRQIRVALLYRENGHEPAMAPADAMQEAEVIVDRYIAKLPGVQRMLIKDVEAIYQGDPAAQSHAEIITAYLSFQAIMIHRLAHALWSEDVPIIPRMMSEYAHEKTGIDIHPGASIGESLMIDHGTGIVIGETAVIGHHVNIYQGVTIGARSLEDGRGLSDVKRHPTIEDYVTLYANCTILGGETRIGERSVVNGGAFVTESVPPFTRVAVEASRLRMRRIPET